MRITNLAPTLMGLSLFALAGCAGTPTAPFNMLPNSQVTAYRLQNYEPPAAAAAATPVPGVGLPGIPGLALPPEITTWITQGASSLQQLIPPGLVPPGLIPGMPATPGVATPATDTTPRFHGFRILSQTQVMDSSLRTKIASVLGDSSNFDNSGANCMYAEMGLSFAPSYGAPPDDTLISFSCRSTQSFGYQWPYQGNGIKSATEQKLADIVKALWPNGS